MMVESRDKSGERELSGPDGQRIDALSSGLDILRLFGPDSPALTLSEIIRLSGRVPSTTLRLVSTLCELEFLEEDIAAGQYRAAVGSLRLGSVALANSPLVRHGRLALDRLAVAHSGLLGLWVRYGESVFLVCSRPSGDLSALTVFPGARFDADDFCAGRLIGAYRSPGDQTIVAAGFVLGVDTLTATLQTVAVPVFKGLIVTAALSYSRLYRSGADQETLMRAMPPILEQARRLGEGLELAEAGR